LKSVGLNSIEASTALDADDADLKTQINADKTREMKPKTEIILGSVQTVLIPVFYPRLPIRVIRVQGC